MISSFRRFELLMRATDTARSDADGAAAMPLYGCAHAFACYNPARKPKFLRVRSLCQRARAYAMLDCDAPCQQMLCQRRHAEQRC
jgi:hypothetical protein